MKTHITALLCLLLVTGCEKITNDLFDVDQLVLFQKEYINHAWGYQHSGIFIDTTGIVKSYNLPVSWNFPDQDGYISESKLNENFDKALKDECSVDKGEILRHFNLLYVAQIGTITDPVNVAADAGTTSYYGYIYEPARNRYKQILLRQNGDFEVKNTSREAQKIYEWLEQICFISY